MLSISIQLVTVKFVKYKFNAPSCKEKVYHKVMYAMQEYFVKARFVFSLLHFMKLIDGLMCQSTFQHASIDLAEM